MNSAAREHRSQRWKTRSRSGLKGCAVSNARWPWRVARCASIKTVQILSIDEKAGALCRTPRATIRQIFAFGMTWDIVTTVFASIGVISPVRAAATDALPHLLLSLNSAGPFRAPGIFGVGADHGRNTLYLGVTAS
jgi:hypothetical protein